MSYSNYEQTVIIDGHKLLGIQGVDGSYGIKEKQINVAGVGFVDALPDGPLEGNFSISRKMVSKDPLLELDQYGRYIYDEKEISGVILYDDDSKGFGFTKGRLSNYTVSCSVGNIPDIQTEIRVYGSLGKNVSNSLKDQVFVPPTIAFPDQSSIKLVVSDFTVDAIVDFSYSRSINLLPLYVLNRGSLIDWNSQYPFQGVVAEPIQVDTQYPIETDITFTMIANEYEIREIKDRLQSAPKSTLEIQIYDSQNPDVIINSFQAKNARLISENINSTIDQEMNISLSYKSYESIHAYGQGQEIVFDSKILTRYELTPDIDVDVIVDGSSNFTSASSAATAGQQTIELEDDSWISIGDTLILSEDTASQEEVVVQSVNPISLESPLLNDHAFAFFVRKKNAFYAFNQIPLESYSFVANKGTYVFKNVPQDYAINFKSDSDSVYFSGDTFHSRIIDESGKFLDYYYGDVILNIVDEFESIDCSSISNLIEGRSSIISYSDSVQSYPDRTFKFNVSLSADKSEYGLTESIWSEINRAIEYMSRMILDLGESHVLTIIPKSYSEDSGTLATHHTKGIEFDEDLALAINKVSLLGFNERKLDFLDKQGFEITIHELLHALGITGFTMGIQRRSVKYENGAIQYPWGNQYELDEQSVARNEDIVFNDFVKFDNDKGPRYVGRFGLMQYNDITDSHLNQEEGFFLFPIISVAHGPNHRSDQTVYSNYYHTTAGLFSGLPEQQEPYMHSIIQPGSFEKVEFEVTQEHIDDGYLYDNPWYGGGAESELESEKTNYLNSTTNIRVRLNPSAQVGETYGISVIHRFQGHFPEFTPDRWRDDPDEDGIANDPDDKQIIYPENIISASVNENILPFFAGISMGVVADLGRKVDLSWLKNNTEINLDGTSISQ